MNSNGLARFDVTDGRLAGRQRLASHPPFELRNARVVLPDAVGMASILVRDGLIDRLDESASSPTQSIDCEGDYILPGLIEPHTDNFERHRKPRPGTFWSADQAILSHDAELAAAGITTAFDAVTLGGDLGEGAVHNDYLNEIAAGVSAQAEGLFRVDHHLHFRCELSSPRLREHIDRAREWRVPRLVSLMDHTPGQGQWMDIERFRQHYAARHELRAHEIDALVARRRQTRAQFAELNRDATLEFALEHRCVLASHDDATLLDIEQAHEDACSIAEFPTSLEAARAARNRGMFVVAGAPNLVRGGSHSGNVAVSELVRHGLCDIFSSDYYPSSLLQSTFMLARMFALPLPDAVARVTSTPARALGLFDRGSIDEGKRADLIRVRDTQRGPVVVSVWSSGRRVC